MFLTPCIVYPLCTNMHKSNQSILSLAFSHMPLSIDIYIKLISSSEKIQYNAGERRQETRNIF